MSFLTTYPNRRDWDWDFTFCDEPNPSFGLIGGSENELKTNVYIPICFFQ